MQRQRRIYLLHTKCRCCEIDTLCGRSLKEGVVFVGSISLVISVVIFLTAVTTLGTIASSKTLYNKNPIVAINLIFGLVTSCLSSYQIVISSLLLWQAFKTKGNIFLLSLWYVSHMSLLTMYLLLFSAKAAVSFIKRHNITALITMFIGIVYEATFIYFAIVVNSYLHSLNQERYL